jgi:1-acyl-sn-glycerol-3-phosphate acyltransferase
MLDTTTEAARAREAPLTTAIALVRSVADYLIISLYVLIAGPVAIALALLFRSAEPLFFAGRLGASVALAVVGIRYRVVGRGHIPPGGVVFAANHQSNVDSPVLFLTLHPRVRMLYKVEFDRIPILSHAMRIGKYVAVDRRDRAAAALAIERAAGYIREGFAFLVHPEGTRSRTGELLPFKKGGFIMAILAQAPIVPVALIGADEAMRKGSWVVRPAMVSVRIGPPVETRGMTIDHRDDLMGEVRRQIEALIAQGPIE